MTIKEFITTAIEGGWQFGVLAKQNPTFKIYDYGFQFGTALRSDIHISFIVLDPEAWKAVGKVKGWFMDHSITPVHEHREDKPCWCKPKRQYEDGIEIVVHQDRTWSGYIHSMVDALVEGKTLEEYIATL